MARNTNGTRGFIAKNVFPPTSTPNRKAATLSNFICEYAIFKDIQLYSYNFLNLKFIILIINTLKPLKPGFKT